MTGFQVKKATSVSSNDDASRYQYFIKVPVIDRKSSCYELESSPSCYEEALALVSNNDETPHDSIQNSE